MSSVGHTFIIHESAIGGKSEGEGMFLFSVPETSQPFLYHGLFRWCVGHDRW